MRLLTVEKVSDEKYLVGIKELNFWFTDESQEKALSRLAFRIRYLLSGKEHAKPAQKKVAENALSEVRGVMSGRKNI
ncbi:MAG: hypothetical protein WC878_01305 [Candidatus Paceibacterota bacterium]|jgi:hypothetical protein